MQSIFLYGDKNYGDKNKKACDQAIKLDAGYDL
jgi:hypothetical protein